MNGRLTVYMTSGKILVYEGEYSAVLTTYTTIQKQLSPDLKLPQFTVMQVGCQKNPRITASVVLSHIVYFELETIEEGGS